MPVLVEVRLKLRTYSAEKSFVGIEIYGDSISFKTLWHDKKEVTSQENNRLLSSSKREKAV